MIPEEIAEHAAKALKQGPDRVVVNLAGYSVPPQRAREQHAVEPDYIFIRDDGWTLGAPEAFAKVALEMWEGMWVAFVRIPETVAHPISEYVPKK